MKSVEPQNIVNKLPNIFKRWLKHKESNRLKGHYTSKHSKPVSKFVFVFV